MKTDSKLKAFLESYPAIKIFGPIGIIIVILIFVVTTIFGVEIENFWSAVRNTDSTNSTEFSDSAQNLSELYSYFESTNTTLSTKPMLSPSKDKQTLLGTWTGSYIAADEHMEAEMIVFYINQDTLYATFSFKSISVSGKYYLCGNIEDDKTISFSGIKWIDYPPQYVFLDFVGNLDWEKAVITNSSYSLKLNKESNVFEKEIVNTNNFFDLNNTGYLSAENLFRKNNIKGYMVNNSYATLEGEGYSNGYVAISGGETYEQVISVCSYAPFSLVYNLGEEYTKISGYIAFDDRTISQTDIAGITSNFSGSATVTLLDENDNPLGNSIVIGTSDLPQYFEFDISGVKKLTVKFDFPYNNFVLENFYKYFNLIDVKLS